MVTCKGSPTFTLLTRGDWKEISHAFRIPAWGVHSSLLLCSYIDAVATSIMTLAAAFSNEFPNFRTYSKTSFFSVYIFFILFTVSVSNSYIVTSGFREQFRKYIPRTFSILLNVGIST